MIGKRALRGKNIHGRESSDERLYLARNLGGRGLKSLRDVFMETKIRIVFYMAKSESKWMEVAWKREQAKEHWSTRSYVEKGFGELGIKVEFGNKSVKLNEEEIEGDAKKLWSKLKDTWKNKKETVRCESLKSKRQQGQIWKTLEAESHIWLNRNIDPCKTAAIISMRS